MEGVTGLGPLHRAWERWLVAGIRASARLLTPLVHRLWEDVLQLGLQGRQARAGGVLKVPHGESVDSVCAHLGPCCWKVEGAGEGRRLRALNRPSWLLRGPQQLQQFLAVAYEDTRWSQDARVAQGGVALVLEEMPGWGPRERCIARVARANGLGMSMWVNSRVFTALLLSYAGGGDLVA